MHKNCGFDFPKQEISHLLILLAKQVLRDMAVETDISGLKESDWTGFGAFSAIGRVVKEHEGAVSSCTLGGARPSGHSHSTWPRCKGQKKMVNPTTPGSHY